MHDAVRPKQGQKRVPFALQSVHKAVFEVNTAHSVIIVAAANCFALVFLKTLGVE